MNHLDVQEYLQQAKALMGLEQYENAILFLRKAEQLNRFDIDVYTTMGIAYANISDLDNARKAFENALKVNKREGIVYFHLGNIELLSGNNDKGIEYYHNAIANGFDDAQIYFSLGLVFEEDNNDDLAIRNYSKAIIKAPMRSDIRIRKARLLLKNAHLKEALITLDALILSNPDVFEGYHLKFLALAGMDRFDEAQQIIEHALELFPDDTGFALDKASILISKKQYEQALEYLQSIETTMDTDNEVCHRIAMEKARIYAFCENMDKTIESLSHAQELSMQAEPPVLDTEAVYLLMNCYVNLEKYDEAAKQAKLLKENEDQDHFTLASYYYEPFCLKKLKQEQEAKELFKQAVDYLRGVSLENPANIDSYAFRIMCLRELEQYEKAFELAEYLVMVKPDLPEAHTLRAAVLTDLGREQEAKEARAKAVSFGGMMANLPANQQ